LEWHVVVSGSEGGGGMEVVGAWEGDGVVAVLALVGGDDDGGSSEGRSTRFFTVHLLLVHR
jgi:hypothetical protein